MRRRTTPLALLALTLAATLVACAENDAPPALPQRDEITIAYDVALSPVLTELLTQWPQDQSRIRYEPDSSTAITLRAAEDHTPPDVLAIAAQTDPPDGERAPVSVRPWLADPIIFASRAGDTRSTNDILLDENTRLVTAHDQEPLGQYARFGLRKMNRWELIKDRVLFFNDPTDILEALESDTADLALIYASQLAEHQSDALKAREPLEVTESARRAYQLIVMTPEGVELARWLADPARKETAAAFGLHPDAPNPNPR